MLYFRLPIPETRNGQIIEHVRTEKKQKRPCPAVQGTWLHVGPSLAGTTAIGASSLEQNERYDIITDEEWYNFDDHDVGAAHSGRVHVR